MRCVVDGSAAKGGGAMRSGSRRQRAFLAAALFGSATAARAATNTWTDLLASGAGTLVVGADNSTTLSSGTLNLNAGTVRVSSNSNFGNLSSINLTGTLEVNGSFLLTHGISTTNGTVSVTAGNVLIMSQSSQL